jgi:hypothetical protein
MLNLGNLSSQRGTIDDTSNPCLSTHPEKSYEYYFHMKNCGHF